MIDYPTIIREFREATGFSCEEIAKLIDGPDARTVYRWQSGESTPRGANRAGLHRLLRTHGFNPDRAPSPAAE